MQRSLHPVLVVGVGRCGTSTVAGILHNKLDVCMGENFANPRDSNPDGYWEDPEFWALSYGLLRSKLTYYAWHVAVQNTVKARIRRQRPWGFKDTRLCYFLGAILPFLPERPRIIRCNRNRELVIASLMKWWKHSRKDAESFYEGRTIALDRTLVEKDHLVISFGKERKTDDDIIKAITSKWSDI